MRGGPSAMLPAYEKRQRAGLAKISLGGLATILWVWRSPFWWNIVKSPLFDHDVNGANAVVSERDFLKKVGALNRA